MGKKKLTMGMDGRNCWSMRFFLKSPIYYTTTNNDKKYLRAVKNRLREEAYCDLHVIIKLFTVILFYTLF